MHATAAAAAVAARRSVHAPRLPIDLLLRQRPTTSAPLAAAALAASTLTALHAHRYCYLDGNGGDTGAGSDRRRDKAKPPPRFGRRLPKVTVGRAGRRSFSTTPCTSDAKDESGAPTPPGKPDPTDEDCPLCKKYSRGPCGSLFKLWLGCTDSHPGVDPRTGEELHLRRCEELAMPLADCLRENEGYYSRLALTYDGVDAKGGGPAAAADDAGNSSGNVGSGMEELAEAWTDLIAEVESSIDPKGGGRRKRAPFPDSIRPEMEVRPSSGWGVASFAAFAPTDRPNQTRRPLILAYLKDQNGTILGAGSGADLGGSQGMLRFGLLNDGSGGGRTEAVAVTAFALYGTGEEEEGKGGDGGQEDVLYFREARLPPR